MGNGPLISASFPQSLSRQKYCLLGEMAQLSSCFSMSREEIVLPNERHVLDEPGVVFLDFSLASRMPFQDKRRTREHNLPLKQAISLRFLFRFKTPPRKILNSLF